MIKNNSNTMADDSRGGFYSAGMIGSEIVRYVKRALSI